MFTFANALAVVVPLGLSTASLAAIFAQNGEDTSFAGSQLRQEVDAIADTFMAARSVK